MRTRNVARTTVILGTGLALVMAGYGCSTAAGRSLSPRSKLPAASSPTTVAEGTVSKVSVFDTPSADQPSHRLANPLPSGTPLVLMVLEDQGPWLKVALPAPNGSTGWVRRGDVSLSQHRYRVVVELKAHRLSVFDGPTTVLTETVAIGTQDAPTPQGSFYITELLAPPNPGGPYGPYAFGLSAHSDVYTEFAGGDGVIGIHGTNDPRSLGRDVSHGCIRVTNDAITAMADLLPLGTPVEIRA